MAAPESTAAAPLHMRANRSACCGYGVCAEICPEIYKLDDNGIVMEFNDAIPVSLQALAREGAAACPQSALEIVEG